LQVNQIGNTPRAVFVIQSVMTFRQDVRKQLGMKRTDIRAAAQTSVVGLW
jgi:hypothetical protein